MGYLPDDFKASKGWLAKFLSRWNLSCRRTTNNHTLTPEERKPYMLQFLYDWRQFQKSGSDPNINRFSPQNMYTCDQVPLEDGTKDSKF